MFDPAASQEELLRRCSTAEEVRNHEHLAQALDSGRVFWDELVETRRRLHSEDEAMSVIDEFCATGHGNLLRKALEERPDLINLIVDEVTGSTPLHVAAMYGYVAAVGVLIEMGADLERRTIDEGWTPLQVAADASNAAAARLLCVKGADVHAGEESWENRPLILAARRGSVDTVKVLLKAGADVKDDKGRPALYWAAYNGETKAVATLARAGVDVFYTHGYGWTPLHHAARRCGEAAVKALLEARVNRNAVNDQRKTALHCAAKEGQQQVVRLLVVGTDVNVRDTYGATPLHDAAHFGNIEAVKVLLEAGANTSVKDRRGATALQKATERQHHKVVLLLQQLDSNSQ